VDYSREKVSGGWRKMQGVVEGRHRRENDGEAARKLKKE